MDIKNNEDNSMRPRRRGYYSDIITETKTFGFLPTASRKTKLMWQIRTEHHSPIVKDIKIKETHTHLGAAERWITFPEDKSIAFPAETFLPKVQMEYIVGPKVLPRNVEMERRRRAYKNLKIEDALKAEGVKSHDMLPPEKICALLSYDEKYDLYSKANYLPLELFDDEEYDCRTADEWINLGIIDGVRYPLPATVFVEKILHKERIFDRDDKTLSNLFGWFPAAIIDYDNKRKLWSVFTLDALKRKFLLPRIYVRFYGEDPEKFAQRIANAVKQRQITETRIRYHFYLDCMLVDGMPTLDEKQQEVIILSATLQGSMKYEFEHLSSLIDEVVLEYRRVMCDLMWRPLIEKQPEMFNFITWGEINDICEMDTPKTRKICTEMKDFTGTKNFFHWIILYVTPEVHEAMQCVVVECIHVSNMNLFIPIYGKSIHLLEYKSQQHQETGSVIKYLKETWVEKITQSVRLCLRDIGKGWFDLEQRRHDIYDVMKLKRFMDLIVYRMQNALRNLVEKSIALYLEMLEIPALCTLDTDENFTWGDDLINTQFKSPVNPIFNIDIAMNDETAYYLTDLESFEEVIVDLLNNSLSQCHQIKQVHPFLLPFLKFPKDLYLSSVGLLEKGVCEVRDRLKTAYQKSIIPLKAYSCEYQQYLGIYKLNIEKYVEDFKNADHTAAEVKDEISFHFKMKSILELTLPKDIVIGPFRVNIQPLKQFLIQKRQNCCTQLLVMFTESLRTRIDVVLSDYMQIRTRLKATSRDIEHLFEEQEWIETIPLTVKALDKIIQKLNHEYDVLDHFWWNLSDQDFEAKWQAIGFPRQIQLHIEEAKERFANEYEKFHKAQIQDEILLTERINTLVGNVTNVALQTDINRILEMAIEVKRIWKMVKDCQESSLLLNERQKLFGMNVVRFEQLDQLIKEFEPYQILWITASDWLKWQEIWMENPLINIDANQIENMVTDMHKAMSRCVKVFQENPKIAAIALTIRSQIEAFKPYVGMIQALRDPGMKTRHFEKLTKKIGIQMELTPTLTFKTLVFLGVMKFEDTVKTVADAAAKEYLIEGALDKMMIKWETITMDVLPYKNTGTYIMKISDEITSLLDDDILNTQYLSLNPFKGAFESRIDEWEVKLKLIQEVIAQWTEVQKQWMYLEPIFSSEDINRQLPVETRKFNTMQRIWKRIMKNAYDCPYIIITCADKILLESLKECLLILGAIQKGLSDYLETKRMIFPRFYFLSDDELLEIIIQSKHVQAVQPHLKKCFENMRELRFEHDLRITKMYSAEYEEVTLRPLIYPEGNVENWLGQVEDAMRNTLRELIGEALEIVETTSRKQWLYMWPGQVVLCGSQTYWTAHVEDGIKKNTLSDYYSQMLLHLEVLQKLIRGPQTDIQRLMLEAVIIIEIHAKDVLHKLIQEKITNVNNFEWISQLRYYWIDNKDLKIRIVNAEFSYEYEYLGNNGRLVITPLTDRCYLTLTGALHLKFGGAPAGPAGTGKTETTKDLAKAFAIQCVVFNCSDQLNFRSMGKFFKGLASAGAWACFDEFNRIDIEVLSVVAQQIMTIQKAQHMRATVFIFEGIELTLKPSCAVFITMNPGYAGRTELPDNLKALFRPVAMMVPNYALIAEISLFSYGFVNAKNLARKITTTFKLSSEQLSTQDHYDFGMRAVKTVIVTAGNLKREQKNLEEDQICLRALRDVNVPKFLKNDLMLFNGIVSDLFPGLIEKPEDYGILEAGIRKSIRQMGLEDVNDFVRKVIQLYETTLVRSGLMLVGPTGSGKTKCYEVLKHTCTNLKGQSQPNGKPFIAVILYVLNPKAITMGQLYGEYDPNTHEWRDGILPTLIRTDIIATDHDKRWYIFDGPVDAVWIENMNSVLDDNKKLCLTSGEIIKLLPTQTMMFEVSDLRVASPATISRCGMVYIDPENLGLQPLIDCWLRSLPKTMSDYIEEITDLTAQLVLPSLKIIRENLREIMHTVDSAIVQSYINLMNFRIGPMAGREGKAPPSFAFQRAIPDLLSPWIAFAIVWGLGAICDYKSRAIFSDWLRKIQKDAQHKTPFPEDGLVFDYRLHDGGFTDPIEGQEPIPPKWYKWLDGIPLISIMPETKYADIEVPTKDNVRSAALIEYLLINETNILCVGPTGSGKTLTISAKLSRNMPKKYICDFVTFSARITANQTQDLIDAKLDKRRKGIYGPPILKKQIFFIDDLNMPALDTYGAQPPIELIRQFMNSKGWYDIKEIGSFRLIEDVNFVAAMGLPGGGRNPITARLIRHFHIIAFPEIDDDAKSHIFKTILNTWLSHTPKLGNMLDDIVNATLKVFAITCSQMLPTPNKSHYTFNLRDLSKVFQGVLMADATKMLTREKLLLLWYHENIRVFSDRLIDDEDRKWFDKFLRDILNEKFHCDVDNFIGKKTLFYGDFCSTTKEYEQITNTKKMEKILLDFLEDYNNSMMSPMQLILFEDAMNQICRIMRILRQPRGNALLLGMGGSGRHSLTKLASHIQEYNCFQIGINKAYTIHDWREDIKNLMLKTGLRNEPIVFLFSDTQIKNDFMLEDLNNILNIGDVPSIYQTDEVDKIYQAMRAPVQEAGLQINRSNLFSAYLKRIRNNLHIIITMSPLGDIFRARIRQFPALVNCCSIDWFCPWPDTALQTVATHLLSDIKDKSITDKTLRSIVRICQYMHSSVIDASDRFLKELERHNYVTPTSYLELLSIYGDLLKNKKDGLNSSMTHLSTAYIKRNRKRMSEVKGLSKLADTEVEVKNMQELLKRMKPEIEKAAKATVEMIQTITEDTIDAEKAKVVAVQQEAVASKMREENKAIRDEAETDLNEVKPLLEAAEVSLKALNKNDITEVKAMKRPPVGVLLVIEAMCIVNNVKPHKLPGKLPGEKILDYWTPGSQMLADPIHFLYTMEHFRKEDITEEMINKLKDYIENPNFEPAKILQVSKACHSLCLWVHAMYNYYFVNKKVEPKMATLAKAEEILVKTERDLAAAMARLQEIEEGIEKLQDQLREKEAKKADLERQKQLCEERMARAVRLIVGLSDEQKRWIIMVDDIKVSLKNAVGDILLSSGAIAYLTPFTDTYRQELLAIWYNALGDDVPHTPGSKPVLTLGNQVEIRNWHINGLPKDALSVENAVLVMNSKRWPLFIDPQSQANKWIRNMYKPIGLVIAKITDKNLLRILENSIRIGKPCLIENVGTELEAVLDPILVRSLFMHAGQLSIKIGENIVPYNFDFRLYLTTKLSNPHYTPEIAVKVLIVNFALTISALVDQMLSLVTIQERPDLEQERNTLIVSSAEMKRDLSAIEDKILHKLAISEESIVDDIDLILTLEASKTKSEEIKIKMKTAELTQTNIDLTRSLYMPVANRAQILFFCIVDLQRINIMYQYSLEWFIIILNNSILNTEKNKDINKRIANITENFTFALFSNVCRSLFERHKMHFAFLVCARILLDDKRIDPKEWRHFLTTTAPIRELPNPAPEWITPRCWREIQALERLSKFDKFVTSFQFSLTQFKHIFDTQEAHLAPFPEPWEIKLDDFEKLLILKCLRPDKLINAIQIYLTKTIGRQFVEPQVTELSTIYEESFNSTPIVFILSPGMDPATELYKFADKLEMSKKLYSISLGQGQGPMAQAILKQSTQKGTWAFLQNCHLAPSWMPQLESLAETLSQENIHRDFRLWLTCAPSPDFPINILQNSSKMTIEPPRGIKANMLRAYLTQVTELQELLEFDYPKAPLLKWLIFSLCMFHSVLLERRKFGPLGFNIPYEFTSGDLAICLSQLHMFLMEYDTLPFKILIYTAGHINYGGRITDDWDRRCVLTLLEDYYDANVVSPDYQFDEQNIYHQLPAAASFNDYLEYIKGLPLNDNPSLFGMHSNADITFAQIEAYTCLETLLIMQPREITIVAASIEEETIQIINDMLAAMPKLFDLVAMEARYPISYEESFNTVLLQEAKRYNDLLEIMQTTSQNLLKALKGLIVMSEHLEMIAMSFLNNKIPAYWQSKSYPSVKSLAAWFLDLKDRIKFISDWRDRGIPSAFWISGFYFPQAFLTGTLQNFARRHRVSIDTIDFSYKILTSKPMRRPSNGCVIYGLFLEGCRWNGNYLVESLPKELFTDMPPILLLPEINHIILSHGIYTCPVYKTIERSGTLTTTGHSTNFVLAMEIPTDKPQSHWIKRGVALICALDY